MKKIALIIIIFLNYHYLTSQNNKNYTIKSININNEYSNFGTSFFGNDFVIYASPKIAVSDSKKMTNKIFQKQRQDMELFFGVSDEFGNISDAKVFNKEVNSIYDELDLVFTSDLKTVYFTRSVGKKKLKKRLELYKADVLTPGFWFNIQKLPFNQKGYSVGHPSLSEDNKTLYFASDMKGTLGDLDIFKISILANNKYGKPVNLGAKINTSKDETTPFVLNNTLYFSSNGRDGFGGLDIFSIALNGGSTQNLGEQINSQKDDLAFTKNQSNDAVEHGYFTSNRLNETTYKNNTRRHIRNKGKKNYDIYYFKVIKEDLDPEIIIKNEDIVKTDSKENKATDILSFYKKTKNEITKTTGPKVVDEELMQRKIKLGLISPTREEDSKSDIINNNDTANNNNEEESIIEVIESIPNKVVTEKKKVTKTNTVVIEVNKKIIETNQVAKVVESTPNKVVTEIKEEVKPDVVVTEITKNAKEETKQVVEVVKSTPNKVVTEIKEEVKPDVVVTEITKNAKEETKQVAEVVESTPNKVVTEIKEEVKPDVVVTEITKNAKEETKQVSGVVESTPNKVVTEIKEEVKPDVVVTEITKNAKVETKQVAEVVESTPNKVVTEIKEEVKPDVVETEIIEKTKEEAKTDIVAITKTVELIENKTKDGNSNEQAVNFRNLNSNNTETNDNKDKISTNQAINFRNLTSDNEETGTEIKLASISRRNDFSNEFDVCQEQLDLINGIYFDLNKDNIRPDAAIQFNKVINILKRCPNINVVVSSHTDCRAPVKYNLELSQRRANSSVEYLIEKGGLARSRFKAIGYGEAILKNRCKDGVRCKESEHQINRRTEIEITNY